MENQIIETQYPMMFRKKDAELLGKYLAHRQSVVLIGMPRVGISNFLRFFLYHEDVVRTYIHKTEHHMFIPVDLNDLVEREMFPFWALTLKRIVDTTEISITLSAEVKKEIEDLFVESIQSKDLFLLIDSVRKSIGKIIQAGLFPTIFFVRFDRIKNAVTPEFFANLQGLKDAMHNKLTYVFTASRGLDKLAPAVFTKSSLSVFSKDVFIQPATAEDAKTIYQTYKKQYSLTLTPDTEDALFCLIDGYVQYLQLSMIFLHEHKIEKISQAELFTGLSKDEQILLQSEELWENLGPHEQAVLLKVVGKKHVNAEEKAQAKYVWDTGFIRDVKGTEAIFSPLFAFYLEQREKKSNPQNSNKEFSKKEHLLFTFLLEHKDAICEREKIIESVWPEVEAFGVSDWAIDRLVARVRAKLKLQESPYEIQTVKTRGYKLISS